MSIFDNVAYGLRERGSKRPPRRELEPQRRSTRWSAPASRRGQGQPRPPGARALRRPAAAPLHRPLAGGQPRGAAARRAVLGARPDLDRRSIEELIVQLRDEVAIVIVTHNLQQAQRVADHVAFMYLGDLVEYGPADQVFGAPRARAHPRLRQRGLRLRSRAARVGAGRRRRRLARRLPVDPGQERRARQARRTAAQDAARPRDQGKERRRQGPLLVGGLGPERDGGGRHPPEQRLAAARRRPDRDQHLRRQGQEGLHQHHPRALEGTPDGAGARAGQAPSTGSTIRSSRTASRRRSRSWSATRRRP